MSILQSIKLHIIRLVGLLCCFSMGIQAQTADLSLVQVQLPDTIVLGEVVTFSAYLKNNTDATYTNDNLQLNLYVNEIQDIEKIAAIQNLNIAGNFNIPSGDSILIEQNVLADNSLLQMGEQQQIQKNIIIVWPTEDNYSINYHLQPIVALKQAIPTVFYNNSSNFSDTNINSTDLPLDAINYINAEYTGYIFDDIKQQNFEDGSVQFEVRLENDEDKVRLYFSAEGILVLTQTEFDESNVLPNISTFIAENYPDYTIDSAYELLFSDGTIQFKVELTNIVGDEIEIYFDLVGNNIAEIGIVIELYEEPDIELNGLELPSLLDLGEEIVVNGSLTNHLAVPYNDVFIPINYATLPFPPTLNNPKLRTQTTDIDLIAPAETIAFQQNLSIEDDLFYAGKNIVIVWPTDYAMNLTSNCIFQEVFVETVRDTVGIETIVALSNDIVIAPNPTISHLNIQTHELQIEAIAVYDIASKVIAHYPAIHQNSFETDISHFKNGMYLLYIQTDKGNTMKKLIIGDGL
ncbi:MAG: T9SS type A sorting domain-containing protein [Chitinophagales bacterium]